MKKIFIQDINGRYNKETAIEDSANFEEFVKKIRRDEGIYLYDDGYGKVFLPFHNIQFIREEVE